jgi:transcriptional regulator with XRE-family HTH domain
VKSYFNLNLRYLRNKKNISQAKLAEYLSLKPHNIGAYEENRSRPSYETLIAIAKYFRVSIDDLLTKNISEFKNDLDIAAEPQASYTTTRSDAETISFLKDELDYLKDINKDLIKLALTKEENSK